MKDRNDWVALELTKQKNRLHYIEATLNGRTRCLQPPRRIFIEPTTTARLHLQGVKHLRTP